MYQPKRMLRRYEKILELMVEEGLNQRQVAERLMLSPKCVCYVVNSDVFRESLRQRNEEYDWAMVEKDIGAD